MLAPVIFLDFAWRNLWRNYRRTLIMLLAIVLGVWAMIFMNAFMRGMVDDMVETGVASLPGHAQIHHAAYRDDPSVINSLPPPAGALREALALARGWSARVRVPAVVASERDSRGLVLLGVEPAAETRLGFAPDSIVAGEFLRADDDRGIVLGARLVERLETRLGKRVVVMSQTPDNDVADRGFRVVGVYKAATAAQEEQFAYVGRDTLQAMLELGGAVSEIAVLGDDYRDLSAWYPQLAAAVAGDDGLELRAWTELDAYLGAMLAFQDNMIFIFVVVIFLVLSFGLVNTIMMAVFERIREFGLMQALGMRPANILLQVLTEASLLLLMGLALGNLLAWATVAPLADGIDLSFIAAATEFAGVGNTLYPKLRAQDMATASALVIALGLAASLLPAWRAARFDPIDAMTRS